MVIMNRKTFAESLSHHKCSVNFSYYHNDNGSSSAEKKKKKPKVLSWHSYLWKKCLFFPFFLIFSFLLSLAGKNVLLMYQLDGQEARMNTHIPYAQPFGYDDKGNILAEIKTNINTISRIIEHFGRYHWIVCLFVCFLTQ